MNIYLKRALIVVAGVFASGKVFADQVILDDLIVDGSACVGQDCVNGESFGFDTIRLKENNLRIKFQDTSATASFPSNDWQITANDSSNGGQNKFSIDDIDGGRTPFTIEAGAPSHSLYVDDGGQIGLGTSTPVVEVHVVDGDTPTVRLEQDGSSGFTPQTWDMAGNETNFFVRDVTNGSTLPFRIRPDAPTSAIDIEGVTGDIGFGTTSPRAPLHVARTGSTGSDHAELLLDTSNTDWEFRSNAVNGTFTLRNDSNTTAPFVITNVAINNLMRIGSDSTNADDADNVHVNGSITASGTITPDYVFEDSYELMSIEEHADFMWSNNHLPKVEAAKVDANGKPFYNLVNRGQNLLEELEIAHIYINQLNEELKLLKKQKQEDMASMEERLKKLEAASK